MNLSCEVIRDLLPLYHDGICSAESRQLVEEHLKTCDVCRQELEDMGRELPAVGNTKTLNDAKPLQGIAKMWKQDKKAAFLKGTFLVSVVACIACIVAYNAIGSYVAKDGTLVEPFGFIPLAWLFIFIALISGVSLLIGKLLAKARKSKD